MFEGPKDDETMGFEHFWLSGFDQIHAAFWTYFAVGLQNGALYAMIAVGYTLVYGVLGLINFAHGDVFMWGGFGGVFLTRDILGPTSRDGLGFGGPDFGGHRHWRSRECLRRGWCRTGRVPTAAATARTQTRLPNQRHRRVILSTNTGRQRVRLRREYRPGPGLRARPGRSFTLFGTPIHSLAIVSIVAAVIMLVVADRIVRATRLGRGIRAVSQDAETSSLMGVNIDRTIVITFILGGALAGAAGFLYSLQSGIVQNAGTEIGIYAFTAAVLGGIGNLRGAALGGLLIGLFGSFSVPFAFEGNVQWTEIYTFLILVLVLIVRPTGILGEKLGRTA